MLMSYNILDHFHTTGILFSYIKLHSPAKYILYYVQDRCAYKSIFCPWNNKVMSNAYLLSAKLLKLQQFPASVNRTLYIYQMY